MHAPLGSSSMRKRWIPAKGTTMKEGWQITINTKKDTQNMAKQITLHTRFPQRCYWYHLPLVLCCELSTFIAHSHDALQVPSRSKHSSVPHMAPRAETLCRSSTPSFTPSLHVPPRSLRRLPLANFRLEQHWLRASRCWTEVCHYHAYDDPTMRI